MFATTIGAALPGMTPDDNLGLLALVSAMLAWWFYVRLATDDQR